ncbi:hypothetical protein D3C79_844780 [compost metagenome]
MRAIDPALLVCNLFKAGNFQALPMFDGLHVLRGFQQAVVGTGIEPGKAATETLHTQIAALQVGIVDVGDFQFAAW